MQLILGYWKFKNGQWTHIEETVEAFPDDKRLNVVLPKGVDLDTATLIRAEGQEMLPPEVKDG